jgi:DNA polymerase (family 10)
VDLRLVPEASFGAAMLYFTGSKQHNIELRKIAIDRGMSLNEYGLTRGEETVAGRTEEEVYRALGLAWVPPEIREALGEIELAREDRLPRLLELEDLRGDLHMHTTRTDGRDSIDGMVEAALARGYEYIAITEHSKAIAMANGFDGARVRESVGEIEAARRRHPGIRILHGLEVDILADGDLDLDDESLAVLDWVIVSIHSRFEQSPEQATARALKAVSHPLVHAFGHPTGRLIGSRPPVPFDLERVAEAAAARGVAMEINSAPDRLDLSDVNARLARTKGCRFVVDTDAHATGQLDLMRYGVFQARRAGLTREDVWNACPFEAFEGWRKSPRAGAAVPLAPSVKPARETEAGRGGGSGAAAPKRIQSAKPSRSPAARAVSPKRTGKPGARGRGKP